jgi:hypothetical protein
VLKACFKCGAAKPLSEFYRHPMMADGHLGKCKECAKHDVRQNREENAEYYRAYDRLRFYERGYRGSRSPEAVRRARGSWQSRNPHKRAAHMAVAAALRSGALKRPKHCSECHTPCTPHGHHDDYDKPLEVRWLCKACHGAWHRKYDEAETRAIVEARRRSA